MSAAMPAMCRDKKTAPAPQTAHRPPPQPDRAKGEDPGAPKPVPETGGPKGPEPTRYGDWEKGGRCSDF